MSEEDERGGVPFPTLSFALKLTRKSHYYVLNIVAPCAIMMVLVISVFWLPADSGEKVRHLPHSLVKLFHFHNILH